MMLLWLDDFEDFKERSWGVSRVPLLWLDLFLLKHVLNRSDSPRLCFSSCALKVFILRSRTGISPKPELALKTCSGETDIFWRLNSFSLWLLDKLSFDVFSCIPGKFFLLESGNGFCRFSSFEWAGPTGPLRWVGPAVRGPLGICVWFEGGGALLETTVLCLIWPPGCLSIALGISIISFCFVTSLLSSFNGLLSADSGLIKGWIGCIAVGIPGTPSCGIMNGNCIGRMPGTPGTKPLIGGNGGKNIGRGRFMGEIRFWGIPCELGRCVLSPDINNWLFSLIFASFTSSTFGTFSLSWISSVFDDLFTWTESIELSFWSSPRPVWSNNCRTVFWPAAGLRP